MSNKESLHGELPMPDVKSVTIQIRPRSGRAGDTGQVSFGYYTVEDGVLTMTDGDGRPVRRRDGELMQRKLKPGDDAETFARIFTRSFRLHVQGDGADFNRQLDYPNLGVA